MKVEILPLGPPPPRVVILSHDIFIPEYLTMLDHRLHQGLADDPVLILLDWGAWRYFPADQEDVALAFLRRMRSATWRIHQCCRYCFYDRYLLTGPPMPI